VRAENWNVSLAAELRASISDSEVRDALDELTAYVNNCQALICEPIMQGVIRTFRFRDAVTNRWPFACIVNQKSLLFYVRLPGLSLLPRGETDLLQTLPESARNAAGELTVRLRTSNDVARLLAYLFHPQAPVEAFVLPDDAPRKDKEKMKALEVVAAVVRQGDLTLYTTSIKVRDLIVPGFYSVETLDPENANDKGYQRLLNTARAKRLADYVVQGQESRDAFLPTSVFLATDKVIPYDSDRHSISIDVAQVGPFSVVDGQHRLEGLRIAAEKDKRVLDFEVPVNIAQNLPKIWQMCHFLIVNTTQKSVDTGVEQRIISRLTSAINLEDMPNLPKWISKRVEVGDEERAVRLVDFLNQAEDSPWKGKVAMANAEREGATINQKSFVKAIVKYVLTANNPLTSMRDFDKEKKIFLNYWKAIASVLDDGEATVVYKYNGVELFCKFSMPFFMKCQDKGSFTVPTQTTLIRACLEGVEGEYAGIGHPDWWASGSKASFMNAGAINQATAALGTSLNRPISGEGPEI